MGDHVGEIISTDGEDTADRQIVLQKMWEDPTYQEGFTHGVRVAQSAAEAMGQIPVPLDVVLEQCAERDEEGEEHQL